MEEQGYELLWRVEIFHHSFLSSRFKDRYFYSAHCYLSESCDFLKPKHIIITINPLRKEIQGQIALPSNSQTLQRSSPTPSLMLSFFSGRNYSTKNGGKKRSSVHCQVQLPIGEKPGHTEHTDLMTLCLLGSQRDMKSSASSPILHTKFLTKTQRLWVGDEEIREYIP